MKQYLALAYGLTHGSPGWDRRELAGLARLCSRARFTGHGDGDGLASSPARGRLRGRRVDDCAVARQGRHVSRCAERARLCPPTPALALAQASRRRVRGRHTTRAREPTAVARPRKTGHVLRDRSRGRAVAARLRNRLRLEGTQMLWLRRTN